MTILFGFIIFVATRDVSSLPLWKLFSSITLLRTQGFFPCLGQNECPLKEICSRCRSRAPFQKNTTIRFLIVFVESSILFELPVVATLFHKTDDDTMSCPLQHYAKCCQYSVRSRTYFTGATESLQQLTIRRCRVATGRV
jgi:hypothetical protein